MRSIARQSARLAKRSRVREPSRSQLQPCSSIRGFHCSIVNQSDARGPNDPPSHQISPFTRQQTHDQDGNTDENSIAHTGDDADPQSSEQSRRTGARKTFRQRRAAPDAPKPPPVPDWFLRRNILPCTDRVKPDVGALNGQVLRCVNKETGQVLFEVPFYATWPPGHSQRHSTRALESAKEGVRGEKPSSSLAKRLDPHFFNNQFANLKDAGGITAPSSEHKAIRDSTPESDERDVLSQDSWLLYVFLEVEASIRAGMSMSSAERQSSSFAASRVDLSLVCPHWNLHEQMDDFVQDLATVTGSSLIRLSANDLSDLTADYVGQNSDAPGTFASLGHEVYDGFADASQNSAKWSDEDPDNEMDEDDMDEDDSAGYRGTPPFVPKDSFRKSLLQSSFPKTLGTIRIDGITIGMPRDTKGKTPSSSSAQPPQLQNYQQWDDVRLGAVLDSILEASKLKVVETASSSPLLQQESDAPQSQSGEHHLQLVGSSGQGFRPASSARLEGRAWRSSSGFWYPELAQNLAEEVKEAGSMCNFELRTLSGVTGSSQPEATNEDAQSRTIVHIPDLQNICASPLGESIIRRLVRLIQKRRRAGEEILVVGTTTKNVIELQNVATVDDDDALFRTIEVPPMFRSCLEQMKNEVQKAASIIKMPPLNDRVRDINIRHLQSMLRRLRPRDGVDLYADDILNLVEIIKGCRMLGEAVISYEQVQRIVLTAIGLSYVHLKSEHVSALHVALAVKAVDGANAAARIWNDAKLLKSGKTLHSDVAPEDNAESERRNRIARLKKSCNSHEGRLLAGVVDAQNIKTGFHEVHAPADTIEALRTLTSLSLLRPDAFKYGVLAQDRLPGLMLYGPPGTGKTLLAKAVAKEAKATFLEITGAQIYEKYVGEGEKMVRAVFSLAKKLSPCVVFLDEADAIFGSRAHSGSRTTHREVINQFLREWDGMDSHDVFIMVASNRPFDFDDAVLRRLPRRILVDLPVAHDREKILAIHLRDEQLDHDVSLKNLAAKTPLYSGSDLKNLCVAAALACVREENAATTPHPDKRTLALRHFDQAFREISASISEDMSSLVAIRKFDEQYGERKAEHRKKASYGFGAAPNDPLADEASVRVRQVPSPSQVVAAAPPVPSPNDAVTATAAQHVTGGSSLPSSLPPR